MKIIKFKEQNIVYAENQPEYLPLPAYKHKSLNVEVVSCWKLTVWERIKLLFTGRVWVQLLTFGAPLQPQYVTINKDEVIPKVTKDSNGTA